MTRPVEWVLASSNAGKLAEFRALFDGVPIQLRALDAGGSGVPEETGATFVENALIKARHAADTTGLPAIADDSGLCVAALAGAPGVRSARFAGERATDSDNVAHLLEALEASEPPGRSAAFHCVIVALKSPDDPAPVLAHGVWSGRIALEPAGSHGFGYDPVFFDPELKRTAAQLEPAVKNRISHRARACAELRRQLEV
jgi:XTP/dITP diphosphohydrolase